MGLAHFRDLLVDISDNLSNGASQDYAVGRNTQDSFVPFAVVCPSNLQSTTHFKVQTAYLNGTTPVDADFHDLYVNGAIATMAMVINGVVGIPEAVATASIGASHVRLVTCTAAGVGADPGADITLRTLFGCAEDIKTSGVAVASAAAAATVQGNVASGVANSGNPVLVGGVFETVPTVVTDGQRRNLSVSSRGELLVTPSSGGSPAALGPPGDGVTNSAALGFYGNSVMTAFNGVSLDRWRNNIGVSHLASAPRTTTQTGADIPTYNFKAITVILDMTVVGASPSVTLTIQGKDPASGLYYTLLAGAAVVTISTNLYSVGPSIAETANVSTSKFLPAIIRILVTANNANTGTYSVGYNLMI